MTGAGDVYVTGSVDRGQSLALDSQVVLSPMSFGGFFLARFDLQLQPLWIRPLPVSSLQSHEFGGLGKNAQGEALLAGSFSDSIQINQDVFTSRGQGDVFLSRVGPSSGVAWSVQIGGVASEDCADISVDPTGATYVLGITDGTSINGLSLPRFGGLDVFLGRFDALGRTSWIKSFGGPNSDFFFSVATDAQGNAYIAGIVDATGTQAAQFGSLTVSALYRAAVIVKVSSAGQVLWLKKFEAPAPQKTTTSAIAVHETPQGTRVYVAGTYEGSVDFEQTKLVGNASPNLYLLALDGTGKMLWVKDVGRTPEQTIAGANAYNTIRQIAVDETGVIHLGGVFESPTLQVENEILRSAGGKDAFLGRFDASGKLLLLRQFGGEGDETLTGVDVSSAGVTYASGYSNSQVFRALGRSERIKSKSTYGFLIRWR